MAVPVIKVKGWVLLAVASFSVLSGSSTLIAQASARTSVTDDADYEVSPAAGRPRTRFVATLRNEGLSTIEYGNPYSIAQRTPDGWRRLRHSRRCAWTMEAHILRPGGSASQRVGWLGRRCRYRRLEPGLYRVSKPIAFTDDGSTDRREDVVHATFRVTRG